MKRPSIDPAEVIDYKVDRKSRRAFLRRKFRKGGLGALMFIACLAALFFIDDPGTPLVILLFTLAAAGLAFEFILSWRARKETPSCGCGQAFEVRLNAARPDDTEYIYVCHPCRTRFAILYSTAPDDIS